jgi:hypothetical protein
MHRLLHFILFACVVAACALLQQCGTPPSATPDLVTGSMRIMAMDTAIIRRISFELDNVKYGLHPNPYVLENVVIGVHKLLVADESGTSASAMVEVLQDRQSDATVWLLSEGPYLGRIAPKFTATSIDNQAIDLQQLQGKVVLLAFFEHT